ncbi:hypothetical protein ACGFR8_31550 [Streptomyces brevispora]|uniref:hypothetical protein n=1 Tax=Streptomyces brevispora TaxID=887462 RepID=UPI00371DBC61
MSRHVSNDLKRRARELADRERIPYSAALARLRTPAGRPTDTAADQPRFARFLLPEYLYVDFPHPDLQGSPACEACAGSGIDAEGRTYASPSDGGQPPLLVEVMCSTCGGCGRAEHDMENGCGSPHADMDEDGLDDRDEDEYDEEPPCFSCAGREFNYHQGFTRDGQGEPDEVLYVRMPCGCTADRMRVILGDLIKVNA